jgi:hypothetical protein
MVAFSTRDLEGCLALYADDASLEWPPAVYRGKKALQEWHQARFKANLTFTSVDSTTIDGDTVRIEGVVTSNRLRAWRIGSVSGSVSFRIHGGKIAEARFKMRPGATEAQSF